MRKGETTRQRIIAEAAPIFNKRGYAGSSIQEILDATGLEKGGLYRHFSGKEELAIESFRYAWERVKQARWLQPLEEEGTALLPAVDRLRDLIKRFVELPSGVPGGCPLMNTAIDTDDGNPALKALALQGIKDWKTKLATITQEGIARGEIRKDVEPRKIANTIIATLEGALMISRLEGDRTAMFDAQSSLEDILRGIAVQPRRENKERVSIQKRNAASKSKGAGRPQVRSPL